MNLLPAQPATAMAATAPNQAAPSNDAAGVAADLAHDPQGRPRGQPGADHGRAERDSHRPQGARSRRSFKYLRDPDLPFDQTLLKVDPNLRYAELMTVINAFSNAFTRAKKEPKLSFDRAPSRRGRLSDRGNEQPVFSWLGAAPPAGPGRGHGDGMGTVLALPPAAAPAGRAGGQGRGQARAHQARPRRRVRDRHRPHARVVPRQCRVCLPARESAQANARPSWPGRAGAMSRSRICGSGPTSIAASPSTCWARSSA